MAQAFLSMKKIYEVKMFDVHVQSGHISNNCSEYWHVEGGSGDLGAKDCRIHD